MSEILEAGGSAAMAVLGLGVLGAVVALALAGLGFTKRRVPLVAWALIPVLVCIVGALGAWSSAGSVFGQLETAEGASLNSVALAGLWQSLTIDWFSRWVAAAVLTLTVWLAGVGATIAVGPAEEARLTPIAAGASAITAIFGAIAIGSYGISAGLATGGYMLAGVLLVGGLGVAFASSRRSLFEEATRVAGMRFTAAAAYVLAVTYASQAVSMGAQIAMFGPAGKANSADLADAVGMWAAVADPVWYVSWIAVLLAVLVAFLGVYSELGDVVQRFTLVDVWATFALLGGLATARVIQESRTDALEAVGSHAPAREIFDAWGTDLAPSVLQVEKKPYDGAPLDGGYGDVVVFHDFQTGIDDAGNPITIKEWRRTWAWTGSSWYADDSPLSCEGHEAGCTTPTFNTQRPPLVALAKGEPATELLEVSKSLPGKQFILLLRRNDVESDMIVPSQLAHKQLGFIAIDVEKDVDLTKDVWVDAGYKQIFWGPTHWFGENEDKDALVYTDTVFKETQAPGVHVLVNAKARVEGIAGSCLTAQNNFEMGEIKSNDIWCSINSGSVDEWRKKAREVWPIPEPENVKTRLTIKPPEGPLVAEVDLAPIEAAFLYENAAVADCQVKAQAKALEAYDPDDPESQLAPTDGRIEFEVVINDRGRVNGTYVDTDKSKLDNRDISSCVAGRYRKLEFDELPERPAPVEGEPKPEPPKLSVLISYDFKKLPTP